MSTILSLTFNITSASVSDSGILTFSWTPILDPVIGYPNFDFSNITSFTNYGSLQKRLSVAIINVINNFPASLQINKVSVGSFNAVTAFNIIYDEIRDETSFEINVNQINYYM